MASTPSTENGGQSPVSSPFLAATGFRTRATARNRRLLPILGRKGRAPLSLNDARRELGLPPLFPGTRDNASETATVMSRPARTIYQSSGGPPVGFVLPSSPTAVCPPRRVAHAAITYCRRHASPCHNRRHQGPISPHALNRARSACLDVNRTKGNGQGNLTAGQTNQPRGARGHGKRTGSQDHRMELIRPIPRSCSSMSLSRATSGALLLSRDQRRVPDVVIAAPGAVAFP